MNGHTSVLKVFETNPVDVNTKTVFYYDWDIITIENLVFGIILLFMASHKDLIKVQFVAYLIAITLFSRWFVILFYTMQNNKASVSQLIPDTFIRESRNIRSYAAAYSRMGTGFPANFAP